MRRLFTKGVIAGLGLSFGFKAIPSFKFFPVGRLCLLPRPRGEIPVDEKFVWWRLLGWPKKCWGTVRQYHLYWPGWCKSWIWSLLQIDELWGFSVWMKDVCHKGRRPTGHINDMCSSSINPQFDVDELYTIMNNELIKVTNWCKANVLSQCHKKNSLTIVFVLGTSLHLALTFINFLFFVSYLQTSSTIFN